MNDGIRHLLEYATKQSAIGREATSAELHSIAEVIDCEMRSLKDERDRWMELAHQWEAGASTRGFAERLEAASSERADVTLFGVDYTALPIDAEGEAIHVGDVMEERSGNTFEVASIMVFGGSDNQLVFSNARNFSSFREPHDIRHYHAPTVEDLLEEFVARWMETHHDDIPALKAEYAAKLRLAEGEDE